MSQETIRSQTEEHFPSKENKKILTVEQVQAHSGPLPDPHTLECYDRIIPGAAERILIMAEKQSAHFCKMDSELLAAQRELITLENAQKTRGQRYALFTTIIMAGVSLFALWEGYPGTAGAIGTTTIIGLVTAFVKGQSNTGQEKKKSAINQSETPDT